MPAVDHFCLTVVEPSKTIVANLKALGIATSAAEGNLVQFTDPNGFVVELKPA
jgi:hypothetical protein